MTSAAALRTFLLWWLPRSTWYWLMVILQQQHSAVRQCQGPGVEQGALTQCSPSHHSPAGGTDRAHGAAHTAAHV